MWWGVLNMLIKQLKQLKREEGLSLIEVVIIILVLSISVVPLSRLSITNMTYSARYAETVQAVFSAEGTMEEVAAVAQGQGYDMVTSGYSYTFPIPDFMTRSVSVYEDSSEGVVYKEVTVSVSGPNSGDVILTTLVVK
jgi:Tfp pilus assembly protein PilV